MMTKRSCMNSDIGFQQLGSPSKTGVSTGRSPSADLHSVSQLERRTCRLNTTQHTEELEICGLIYKFTVSKDQRVSFGLVGGSTSKGRAIDPNDLFNDQPKFSDVNLTANALPVLLRFKQELVSYIHEHRPWILRFAASTKRKVSIYRWMSQRALKQLPSYKLIEFPPGQFVVHRSRI